MVWVATAIIGSAVVGAGASLAAGSKAAGAARDSAQIQADAANRAADINWDIYNSTKSTLSPFVGAGQAGVNALSGLVPGGLKLPTSNFLSGGAVTTSPSGGAVPGGTPGGGSAPDLTSLNPANMSPEQIAGLNSFLTGQVRDQLAKKYAGKADIGPGQVGGAEGPDGTSVYNPENVSVDVTQPGWDLATIAQQYPGIDLGKATAAVAAQPQPGESTPSPFLTNVQSQLDPNNPNIKQLNSLVQAGPTQVDPGLAGAARAFVDTRPGYANPLLSSVMGFTSAGKAAGFAQDPSLTALNGLLGIGSGSGSPDPKMIQAALEATPGYQFTLGQGLKATQNSYAAKGLGSSGAAMRGAADYATGLSGATYEQRLQDYLNNYNNQFTNNLNAYDNVFTNTLNTTNTDFTNRYNANNSAITNTQNAINSGTTNALNAYGQQVKVAQDLINTGENAAAQTGVVGTAAGQTIGNTLTGGAAASAAGIVGAANATSNALTNVAGQVGNAAVTSSLLRSPTPAVDQSATAYFQGADVGNRTNNALTGIFG